MDTKIVDPDDGIPLATGRTPTPTAKQTALVRGETVEIDVDDSSGFVTACEMIVIYARARLAAGQPFKIRVTIV